MYQRSVLAHRDRQALIDAAARRRLVLGADRLRASQELGATALRGGAVAQTTKTEERVIIPKQKQL